MKKLKLLLLTLLFSSAVANAQMVLEYNIATANTEIALPLYGTVNVSVNWGDGTALQTITNTGNIKHTFISSGIKTVRISGVLTQFGSNTNITGNARLTKVKSWENLGLNSFYFAFNNAFLLTEVPTSLPASVTNLSAMFNGTIIFNQPIGTWNTSSVTDISYIFRDAHAFNQPIGSWNTSTITNMNGTFLNAKSFNQPIGTWNTTKVTKMSDMFHGASAFNQPIDTWNTDAVINMSFMFTGAQSFNQPLNTWNTGSVTNMYGLFNYATKFNQNISDWNTSSVTDMGLMFNNADVFNQPIGSWNTSKVTNMTQMFISANLFNQNIGTWNVESVTKMDNMFYGTSLCTDNYDATLKGWAPQLVKTGVLFHAGTSKYSTSSESARATLVSKGWTITDAGLGTTSDAKCTVSAVNNTKEIESLNVFPNPVNNQFSIELPEKGTLELLNSMGEIVLTSFTLENISLENLANGVYIYQVKTENKNYTGKLIKE